MTSDDQAKAMNVNDIVFSASGEGKITHAIIGGAIFFADDTTRAMVNEAIRIEREACIRDVCPDCAAGVPLLAEAICRSKAHPPGGCHPGRGQEHLRCWADGIRKRARA